MPIDSEGRLQTPLDWGEVASVLGAASFDEGTLCTHPNINKWSLHKPIPDSHIEVDRNSRWYDGVRDGKPLKCGMSYGDVYDAQPFDPVKDMKNSEGRVWLEGNGMFVQMYKKTAGNWDYIKPSHTKGDWYRIGDFGAYQHNAVNPLPHAVGGIVRLMKETDTQSAGEIECVVPSQKLGGITLEQLGVYNNGSPWADGTSFDNMYLGVLVFDKNFTECFWATQDVKFKDRDGDKKKCIVHFKDSQASNNFRVNGKRGLYYCVTFFSSHSLPLFYNNFSALSGSPFFVPCNNEPVAIALLKDGEVTRSITFNTYKNLASQGSSLDIQIIAIIDNWEVSAMYVNIIFVGVDELGNDVNDETYTVATNVHVAEFNETKVTYQIKKNISEKGYLKFTDPSGKVYKSQTLTRS